MPKSNTMNAELYAQIDDDWVKIAERTKVSAQELGQWRSVVENSTVPLQIRETYDPDA